MMDSSLKAENNGETYTGCQLIAYTNKNFPHDLVLKSLGKSTLGRNKKKPVQKRAREHWEWGAVYHNGTIELGWPSSDHPILKHL